jgi:outer membrane protein
MKNLIILLFAILTSFQINAQSKVGTIDIEYILSVMPQLEQVNNDIKAYSEELENQSQIKITNYNALVKVYQEKEASYDEALKKERQDEIIALEQDIQKFQKNASSLVQIRQNELANPLYQSIGEALNIVAEEGKFTQVFTINNTIAYLDPDLDITLAVIEKMGIVLPTIKGED